MFLGNFQAENNQEMYPACLFIPWLGACGEGSIQQSWGYYKLL